jgi:predicted transcriptional regulator
LSKYRNRIEIVADILSIVKNGARKTQIMYKGNLSYKLLTRYLAEVIGAGLVCAGEKANLYQLTQKGEEFLQEFESYSRNRVDAEKRIGNVRTLRAKLEDFCSKSHVGSVTTLNLPKKNNGNDKKISN